MTKILITGALGNVGVAVLQSLRKINHQAVIYAGVREKDLNNEIPLLYAAIPILFDITKVETFDSTFKKVDILFLLRPPAIANVKKYFTPLVISAKKNGIKHIIFLSVQGVEKSKFIPHNKIEKLIEASKIPFTFLRPAYFMQNFTTTLYKDIMQKNCIYLPAGQAEFTIIDVDDIGNVAAMALTNPQNHINKCYELTNNETLTFGNMASIISKVINRDIKFISPNLFQFYLTKRKENVPTMLILVMIMLHYLPRFQSTPPINNMVRLITQKEPNTFEEFLISHKNKFLVK